MNPWYCWCLNFLASLGMAPPKTSDFQSDFLKTFQRGHMTSVNITRKPHLSCLSCSSKIGPLDQVQTKWLYLSKNPLARMGLGSQDSLTVSLGRCRILLHAIVSRDFRVLTKLPTTKVHTLFFTGFDPSKCPATVLASSLIPTKMDGTYHDSCQTIHEPRKKRLGYFPLNPGWLIGILIMVWYNPHKLGAWFQS